MQTQDPGDQTISPQSLWLAGTAKLSFPSLTSLTLSCGQVSNALESSLLYHHGCYVSLFYNINWYSLTEKHRKTKPVTKWQLLQTVQKSLKASSKASWSGRDCLRPGFLNSNSLFSSPNEGKRHLILLQGDEEYVPGVNWVWQLLPCFHLLSPPRVSSLSGRHHQNVY